MMQKIIGRYFFLLLAAVAIISCNKDAGNNSNKYIVSAKKIIGFTGNNWNNVAPQLKNKVGYRYEAATPAASNNVKAEVRLPAIDDSTRIDSGEVYINVGPDNIIGYTSYETQPLTQKIAFAIMLNYHFESMKTLTGITDLYGGFIENRIGGKTTVEDILFRLKNGQAPDQLAIHYRLNGRGTSFTIVVFKQNDGRYQLSYRGDW